MKNAYEFFAKNFYGLAGFWGDRSLLGNISIASLIEVASKFGYTFIDNGDTFVLAKHKYCA